MMRRIIDLPDELYPRSARKQRQGPLRLMAVSAIAKAAINGPEAVNITTISISICDFMALLLGYYFVERIAKEASQSELSTFLMCAGTRSRSAFGSKELPTLIVPAEGPRRNYA